MSEDLLHSSSPDASNDAQDTLEAVRESSIEGWVDRPEAFTDDNLETLSRDELMMLARGMRSIVHQQEAKFACITEIGSALGTTFNLDELLDIIMGKITQLMGAERSTLFLVDTETNELWSKVSQGVRNTEIRLKMGEGIAGWVAMTGKSINIHDAYSDPRFNPEVDAQTGYQTRSIICQPIRNQEGKIIGVVQVLNRLKGHFTSEDENLLSAIASQAAIAIENSKLYLSVIEKNMELVDLTDKLEHKIAELDLLYDIERELSTAIDLDSLVDSLTLKTADVFDAEGAALVIREQDHLRGYFQVLRAAPDTWEFKTHSMSRNTGITGGVIESGEPYMCNTGACEEVPGAATEHLGVPVHNVIAVPLFDDEERCIGALKVVNHRNPDEEFTQGDLKVLSLIASRIAGTVVARRRHEELEKANRLAAIGQTLSGVIHDLKNPISIISGYVQLMARSDDAERRQEFADSVMKQFEQLNQMTQELLNFARGEKNLLTRKTHLNNFFDEVHELLVEELGKKDVELVEEIEFRGEARFDPAKMKRAILNLARNAADAMPDGGEFRVRAQLDPDDEEKLLFTFEDTGGGIPEEIRESLFDSFVTKGKQHGTGLGLAIVKKIVDEHKGTISFESTPNEGTTFFIRIPRYVQ